MHFWILINYNISPTYFKISIYISKVEMLIKFWKNLTELDHNNSLSLATLFQTLKKLHLMWWKTFKGKKYSPKIFMS